MAEKRKLQAEIDKTLKRVDEGILEFDALVEKVQTAVTASQKEKVETELKREIKKLQRFRDQIKTWLSTSDVKDKGPLEDSRRSIEKEMEKFKVCEKLFKVKAFSKEGLSQPAKVNPQEAEREKHRKWIRETLDHISTAIDFEEAEVEKVKPSTKKGKHKDSEKVQELEERVTKLKWHLGKLEQVLRGLENEAVQLPLLEDLKDYMGSCFDGKEVNFDALLVASDSTLYDSLGLEDLPDPAIAFSTAPAPTAFVPSHLPRPNEESSSCAFATIPSELTKGESVDNTCQNGSLWLDKGKAETDLIEAATQQNATDSVAALPSMLQTKQPPNDVVHHEQQVDIYDWFETLFLVLLLLLLLVCQTVTTPHPSTLNHPAETTVVTNPSEYLHENVDSPSSLRATASPAKSTPPVGFKRDLEPCLNQTPSRASAGDSPSHKRDSSPLSASSKSPLSGNVDPSDETRLLPDTVRQLDLPQGEVQPEDALGGNNNCGGAGFLLSTSCTLAEQAVVAEETLRYIRCFAEMQYIAQIIDAAVEHLPTLQHRRWARYTSSWPSWTGAPPSFPQNPLKNCATPAFISKLGLDTLFFIFYYQQGTYQQSLAARRLKHKDWVYHKRFLTWLQPHSPIKRVGNDGAHCATFLYFDNEFDWCTRIKQDLPFDLVSIENEPHLPPLMTPPASPHTRPTHSPLYRALEEETVAEDNLIENAAHVSHLERAPLE